MMTPNLFDDDGRRGLSHEKPLELSLGMTLYSRFDLDREAKAAAEQSARRDGKTLVQRKPVWTLAIHNAGDGTRISLVVSYRTTDQEASEANHTTNMAI